MDTDRFSNVSEPLLASVERFPDRTAVVFKGRELTYSQFNAAVNQTSHVLSDRCAVQAGDRVAYLLPNCVEILQTYYAVQKLGAVAVPINFKHIARELAYLVGSSGASVLVFAADFAEKVAEAAALLDAPVILACTRAGNAKAPVPKTLAGIDVVNLDEACAQAPDAEPELFRDAESFSRIQFTGGSTGLPKGACRTHRADLVELAGVLDSNAIESCEHPVVLIQCPLEHHGGHSWFTMAFAAGATLVICAVFSAENILAEIERRRVTHMILLPPITYLRLLHCPTIDSFDLSSVLLVQSAAGATSLRMIESIYRHFPNALLNYGWGQSESGLGTSLAITRQMLQDSSPLLESVGRPMKGLELRVVDDAGNPVGPGVAGEAQVRSGAVMAGYWQQPELTERVFAGDGWLRTGDIMVCDQDGYCKLVSRKRDIIKSGGENVFIGEVERAISEHPGVADVVVLGTTDPVMGEAVAAVVQPEPGANLTKDDIQQWCKRSLASYKKPRYVLFVEDMGRDDAGKVRRDEISELFESKKSEVAPKSYTLVAKEPPIYCVSVPTALKSHDPTNAYLLDCGARALLVDTGVCEERALEALTLARRQTRFAADDVDVFLTHHHFDHRGLAFAFAGPESRIFMSKADADAVLYEQTDAFRQELVGRLERLGVQGCELEDLKAYAATAEQGGGVFDYDRLTFVEDGQDLCVGDQEFVAVSVPGHTVGGMALLHPASRSAFFGDAILMDVNPCVMGPYDGTDADMVQAQLDTMERIRTLDFDRAFVGHGPVRQVLTHDDIAKRAEAIAERVRSRRDEIRSAVKSTPGLVGTDVAKSISWSTRTDSWSDIPFMKRFIMYCEVDEYLEHLVRAGEVVRRLENGTWKYAVSA